jgi:hypothetical protein
MPYEIRKKGDKWCVHNKDTGESKGCSDSEKMAKKHMDAMYANEKSAYAEFSMSITKASIPDKKSRTMRLSMVTSDTGDDVYEERMSVELYNDFVQRIESNAPVPEPFNDVVCEDGWCGGLPYPSISHYKSGAGNNVPGDVEKVYVDGDKLKSSAVLHDNPLGLAVWKSVCQDIEDREKSLEERTYENPVRISIGFLDLEHKHVLDDGEECLFTRTGLKQSCPKCDEGINGKVYLKGQLVHLAFTRRPANPRTSVEVMRMGEEIKTRKDDAKSIVGELADELVGKSTVEDNILVVKSEIDYRQKANDVETAFSKKFAPPPRPSLYVRKVTDKYVVAIEYNPTVDYYEENSVYKVGYSEKGGEISFDERSKWVEMEYGLMPKKSEATENDWEIEFENKFKTSEEVMDTVVEKPVEEVAVPVVAEVVSAKSKVDVAVETFRAKMTELKSNNVMGDAALKELQPFFTELGNAAKEEVTSPAEASAEVTRTAIREEVAAIVPEIVSQILKSLPAGLTVAPTAVNVHQPRSLLIHRSGTPENKEKSLIRKLAEQTTIGQM